MYVDSGWAAAEEASAVAMIAMVAAVVAEA